MSPVSGGRKPRKSAKRAKNSVRASAPGHREARAIPAPGDRPESALAALQRMLGSKERPAWFDEAITRVLDGADALLAADGPRELEQLTTELVGAQLFAAIHETGEGLRFGWWFAELAEATRDRFEKAIGSDGWRSPFWLLHGLAAIARPGLAPTMPSRRVVTSLRAAPPPRWLFDATRITATGEVCLMRDTYGTRYAVIARYAYPRTADRPVLLLDIDASGFIVLAGVGVFDDVDDAAAAWRESVGHAAGQSHPEPVTHPDQLTCLVQLDTGDELMIRGDEARSVVDNWFRADRRIGELHRALAKRRMPLAAAVNLYRDVDSTVMGVPFTEWYVATHGTEPDPEAVEALALEWMAGALPETWFAVSPRRVEFQRSLIDDWMPDPVTTAVQTLMPAWVCWLGERAGLPDHLRERVDTAAR